MSKSIFERFRKFAKDKCGNVAVVSAVALMPVLGLAGAALDFSTLSNLESEMQQAADAAALAAARESKDLPPGKVRKIVRKYFAANSDIDFEVKRKVRVKGKQITNGVEVNASVKVKLLLMDAFNKKYEKVSVRSVAAYKRTSAEMALVLDNTTSMNWGSWDEVSDAIGDVLSLIEEQSVKNSFYVTLVPFTDRINISKKRKDWLRYKDSLKDWEGCVEPQEVAEPGYPFAIDKNASPGDFIPTVPKYWTGKFASGNISDCAEPIFGPSTDIDDARDALEDLNPKSATGRFDDALMWGWRAVSEQWRGEWTKDKEYPSKNGEKTKIVALFTDGKTNINKYEMERANGEFGDNNGSKKLFTHFERICDIVKNDGVRIFIFDTARNPHAEPYFKRCAGDYYFKVSNQAELLSAVRNLASEGENLRLTH